MEFRIEESEMLERLKERSLEITNKLGLDLPLVQGYQSFNNLFCECQLLVDKEQSELPHDEFKILAQNLLNGIPRGVVGYANSQNAILEIPQALHHEGWGLDENGTASVYFLTQINVIEEGDITSEVLITLEARTRFGGRAAYSEQVLKGKKSRILAKIFGEKIVAKVLAKSPLKFQGRVLLTDEYIPEWYLKLGKDEKLDSCMSHHGEWYRLRSDEHPTLPYEGLKSTYLALVYDESKGKVVGRSIVRYLKGAIRYNRAYGSPLTHTVMKKSAEYGFDSIAMKIIYNSDGEILCPYVDGLHDEGFEIRGDYLRSGGPLVSDYETGTCGEEGQWCEYYEEYVRGQDFEHVPGWGSVCENALEDYFQWVESRDCYVHHTDCVWSEENDEYYHTDDAGYCEYSEDYFLLTDMTVMYVDRVSYEIATMHISAFVEYHMDDADLITDDDGTVYFEREEEEDAA